MTTGLDSTLVSRRTLGAIVAIVLAALVFVLPQAADADVNCDLVAATNGSDSAAGTVGQPFKTPKKLADSLTAGQTGCLRGGTYTSTSITTRISDPGVTLTSYPGERAKLVGRLWVDSNGDGAQVLDLDLDGRNGSRLPSPMITGHDTVWRGNDVTNGHTGAICFHLGSGTYGNANRTLIENNRIHNCGKLPAANHHHGIYVLHANDSVIRDNLIYDNADRGVNFYPNSRRTKVIGNVIDGNGEGVMYSGGSSGPVSSDNIVAGNIISNSKVRYNVESYWSNNVGSGNVARRNCVFASNTRSSHYNSKGGIAKEWGFKTAENVIANPQYVDRAAKDFRLQDGSACQGYGPGTTAN